MNGLNRVNAVRRGAALVMAGTLATPALMGLAIGPGSAAAAVDPQKNPSAPTLTVTSSAATATDVGYTLTFISINGLTNGFSTVTLDAPADTVFAARGCGNYIVTDDTTRQTNSCSAAVLANGGRTAVITAGVQVNPGDVVTLTANGVSNPSKEGRFTLRASTSSDPTVVRIPLQLTRPSSVGPPDFNVTSPKGGKADGYTMSFIATNGLTAGISTIDLAASAPFPVSACQIYVVSDDTTRQTNACARVTLSSNARQAIVNDPMVIHSGDRVTIHVSTGSSKVPGGLQISTSSDPKPVKASAGSKGRSAGLRLSSYTASATEVSYSVSFQATSSGRGGGMTINLAAPKGTSFPKTTGCGSNYLIEDITLGQTDGCVTVTHGGTSRVSLATNLKISAGDQITAIAGGVGNPQGSGTVNLRLDVSPGSINVSLPFNLTKKTAVGSPVLRLSSYSASATNVTYTISFFAGDGLAGDLADVRLAPPVGATLPPAACGTYVLFDGNTSTSSGCLKVTLHSPGKGTPSAVIGMGGLTVNGGDELTLIVNQVTNPHRSGAGRLTLSTSSDAIDVVLPVKLTSTTSIG